MAGEIASAWIALNPTMRGFGGAIVQQGGPQIAAAGRQLGVRGGTELGAALGGSTAKAAIPGITQVNSAIVAAQSNSGNWLTTTAGMAVKNVALYGSMYAAIRAVQGGVEAAFDAMVGFNAELEQSQIGFTTLLKSSGAAREQMAWIKDFAKESPFRYENLVGYSQQLIALGFNAEESRKVIVAAGDAAAALGRGEDGIARINLALGQMWTKGKVQSQEMLQLTEAGIGAWQILADAYGTSVGEIQDAVTAGLISAKDAVPALLAGMEAQFGGLMEAQANTFQGRWSNVLDTLQQDLAEAGEPLFKELSADAKEFLDALDSPEALQMMKDFGGAAASGAKFLGDAARFGWEFRDAIVAAAAGFATLKLAQAAAARYQGGSGIGALLGGTVGEWKAASLAAGEAGATAAAATRAASAAQKSFSDAALTYARTGPQVAAANAEVRRSVYGYGDWQVATEKLRAAQSEQFHAQQALTAAAPARVAAEAAQRKAVEASTVAEAQLAAARRATLKAAGSALLSNVGPMVGLLATSDGLSRTTKAAEDGTQAMIGLGESVGGAALAGAALGSVLPGVGTAVGAVAGGVIGLVGGVYSMSAAMQAANADVTAVKDALVDMGVEARIADLATQGLTNEQLAAAGGFEAIADAMRNGTLADFADDLGGQAEKIKKQIDAIKASGESLFSSDGFASVPTEAGVSVQALERELDNLNTIMETLGLNGGAFAKSQEQVVAANYAAAYSADLQTGALGETTKAAWAAVQAEGGLSETAAFAAVQMENLAGTAGFATEAILGIPAGTPINFSTNALDVIKQIVALSVARDAVAGDDASAAKRVSSLNAQIAAAQSLLSGLAVSAPLSLQTGTGSRAGGKAAQAVSQAAQEAARKLESDRNAQLRFADAFGSLMESALGGNFDTYRDRLEEQITSLTRDGYGKAADTLKRLSSTLTQATLDYAALTNKLKAATSAYDDLTGRMQDQYNASRDLVLGLGKATDAQSFDQLAYLLGETTSAATQYQDALKALKDQGLSEDLWNQLAQAGPESIGLAQSILAQGQAGIDQLNSLSSGLLDAAESMGERVAKGMYQQGADAMSAYIEGLMSGSDALRAQMEQIANNVLNQTASTIAAGNAGYAAISAQPKTTVNNYSMTVTIPVDDLAQFVKIQDFLNRLEQAPTTQLVNQAGTVTS